MIKSQSTINACPADQTQSKKYFEELAKKRIYSYLPSSILRTDDGKYLPFAFVSENCRNFFCIDLPLK